MVLQTKNGSETPQVFLNHKFKSKIPLHIIITPRENAGFAERPHRGHNTSRA